MYPPKVIGLWLGNSALAVLGAAGNGDRAQNWPRAARAVLGSARLSNQLDRKAVQIAEA